MKAASQPLCTDVRILLEEGFRLPPCSAGEELVGLEEAHSAVQAWLQPAAGKVRDLAVELIASLCLRITYSLGALNRIDRAAQLCINY